MNDFFLFLGILVFLFVLWIYNGGPNNPISFAGPYITPVTNIGDVQEGYGASANYYRSKEAKATGSLWGSWFGGGSADAIPAANRSPYAGKVTLGGGNAGARETREEYLTIRSESDTDISISGWQLASTKTSARATIPQGSLVANYGSSGSSAIVLNARNEAIVTTGKSPIGESFRETKCTGYLDTNSRYSPSLRNACPSPTDELKDFYVGDARRYDQCLDYVRSLSSCRVPSGNAPSGTAASCKNFVESALTYKGCVAAHRDDADFRGSAWRIFLGQSKQLWRQSGDTIQLLDANGKVVDQYSY